MRWLTKEYSASGTQLGFLPGQAVGYRGFIRNFIRTQAVGIILTGGLLLSPEIGLAKCTARHRNTRYQG